MNDPDNWQLQGVGDFNGDGMSDILWRSPVTGQMVIWLVDGRQMILIGGGSPSQAASLDWQFQATGDFDADGKSDILFRCRTGATQCTPGQFLIFLMYCSTGPLGQCTVIPAPASDPGQGSGLMLQADNKTPEILADTTWQIVQTGVYQNDANNSDRHSGILWFNGAQLLVWHIIGNRTHANTLSFPINVGSNFQLQTLNAN